MFSAAVIRVNQLGHTMGCHTPFASRFLPIRIVERDSNRGSNRSMTYPKEPCCCLTSFFGQTN